MAATFPDVGEVEALTRIFTYEGSKLKLYTNNVTWAEGSTVGNATECSTGGYAQKTLLATTWSISTGAGNTSQAAYAQQTFTCTSALTAYGYMVTNSAGTVVICAEAFTDGPYVIPSGGGNINVTLNITLS